MKRDELQTPYQIVVDNFELPFPLRKYQERDVNLLAPLKNLGLYYDQGCVDSETEYLSPAGWVKIKDYKDGEVGQYHLDGTVTFVKPDDYVRLPCPEMYHLKTSFGVDQMLSPEHRVLYSEFATGNLKVISAEALAKEHKRLVMGFRGQFITTFTPPVRKGLDLTDAELRVQVAVIADGYFGNNSNTCIVSLKKERKQSRLVALLVEAGIQYKLDANPHPSKEGFMTFSFKAPLRVKEFDERFYECSHSQLAVISDEFKFWDGSVSATGKVSFSTSSKASADFIQFALASTGFKSSIRYVLRRRPDRKDSHEYTVTVGYASNLAGIGGAGPTKAGRVKLVPSTDGFKYCFSVPSTFLIFRRNGRIFASGNTGKTVTATASALYKMVVGEVQAAVVIMPPILLTMWERWLKQIPGIEVVRYQGTPKQRQAIQFRGHFFLMSIQVFKLDYEYLERRFRNAHLAVIVDEAHSIKNTASASYKAVRDFSAGHSLMLLTGTPVTSPADAYAYCKLIAPETYRNKGHFDNLHVEQRDFFGNVAKWKNLDLIEQNMKINSTRVLREEVLAELPPVIYTPIVYSLSKKHYALYDKLAEEQILRLENGGKIDATTAQALYFGLQQIVTNYDHFSGNEEDISTAYEVVDQVLDEMGGKKLVIFGNYRMTNRTLLRRLTKYNAVAAFGDNSPKQNQAAIDAFINDPSVKVFIGQPTSVGYGVDGLQKVCNDALFLETPTVPRDFHQAVARLWRSGQTSATHVRIAIAEKTIQVRLHKNLLTKDEMVNSLVGGWKNLREAIYGD